MSESQEEKINEPQLRPGRELKKIREQAGVTLAFIAEKTLISEARLRALENDDYDGLGSHTYVTGYARAYAKVVGFDATSHIESFEKAILQLKGNVSEEELFPLVHPKPKGMLIAVVAVAAALVVIVITVVVLVFSKSPSSEPSNASQPSSAENKVLAENKISAELRSEPSAPASLPITLRNRDQSAYSESNEITIAEEPSELDLSPTAQPAPVSESPSVQVAPADAVEISVSEERTSELVFDFIDDCWVRIVDANGRRLEDGIKKAGDRLTDTGVEPFMVKLGNARVVAITLNDEPVAFTPKLGSRTLELTIGQSSR